MQTPDNDPIDNPRGQPQKTNPDDNLNESQMTTLDDSPKWQPTWQRQMTT
jgi:hypothetical protein